MTKQKTKPKLHWSKFKPEVFTTDARLCVCSLAAQGLMLRLMCLMHNDERYGYLVLNGEPIGLEEVCRLVGHPMDEVEPALAELLRRGVLRRDEASGMISCLRMIREYDLYVEARTNGAMGGNPELLAQAQAKVEAEAATAIQAAERANEAADKPGVVTLQQPNQPKNGGNPLGVKAPLKAKELKELEERVQPTAVSAARSAEGGSPRKQGSLLDEPPPPPKPLSPHKRMQEVCVPILARIKGKNLNNPKHVAGLCTFLNGMYAEAGKKAEHVISLFQQVPLDTEIDRALAVGWIENRLKAPHLTPVASQVPYDEMDGYGIQGWCRAAKLEECADGGKAHWLTPDGGYYFDLLAAEVAQTAQLPWNWRGDWSPLLAWCQAGFSRQQIVEKIRDRTTWAKGYEPPADLARGFGWAFKDAPKQRGVA